MPVSDNFGGFVALLAGLAALATKFFLLWVAWRAMRAHERIADVLTQRSSEP